ncbi:MAG: hypothetical protein WBW25_05145 [Halobacteriota archaeon]
MAALAFLVVIAPDGEAANSSETSVFTRRRPPVRIRPSPLVFVCVGLKLSFEERELHESRGTLIFFLLILTPLFSLIINGPENSSWVLEVYTGSGQTIWESSAGKYFCIVFFLFSLLFVLTALYFALLLAKPQFTILHLGKKQDNVNLDRSLQKFGGPLKYVLGGLYLGVSLARSPQKVFFVFYALVAVWYLVAVFNSILQQGQRFGPIFGSSALLLLSLLLSGLLGYQVIRGAECVEDARNMPRLNGLIQEVLGILPRKVNVGETHNIEMEFYLKAPIESQERYEAEPRAAGVTVDGNRQISISPSSAVPTCIWSCFFQNSGIQTFNVSLSQIKGGDTKNFIFTHPHDVKVESKVSASLQSVLAIVVSLLSAVAAFIHLFA